jgi:O-antigen/teichoic acid export membrane protein
VNSFFGYSAKKFHRLSDKAVFISKSTIYLFVFGFVRLILKFSASIIVARVLGPNNYGFWSIAELIHKYSPLVTFGVPSGVKYQIPFWVGKNNHIKANDITNTGLVWMVVYAIIMFCVGLTYYLISNEDALIKFAIISTFTGAGLFQLYQYLNVTLLAKKQFDKSSLFYAVEGLLFFIVSLSLVYSFNIYGQLMVLPLISLIMIMIYFKYYKSELKLEWKPGNIINTIKIGFLMILVGMGYMLLLTINRLLIGKYLGLEAVGYFSLSMLVITLFSQLTGSLGEVMYTFMNEHIGKYGRVDNMKKLVFYPAIGKMLVIPILTSIAIILIPYFIENLMPQYSSSIQLSQIVLIIITLISGSINILGSYLKQKLLLLYLFIAITINICLSLIALINGYGLSGVGVSLLVSLLVYHSLVTISSLYFMDLSKTKIASYFVVSLWYPIMIIIFASPAALGYGSTLFQYGLFSIILIQPIIIVAYLYKKPEIIETLISKLEI